MDSLADYRQTILIKAWHFQMPMQHLIRQFGRTKRLFRRTQQSEQPAVFINADIDLFNRQFIIEHQLDKLLNGQFCLNLIHVHRFFLCFVPVNCIQPGDVAGSQAEAWPDSI